jgi:hypothetical protein
MRKLNPVVLAGNFAPRIFHKRHTSWLAIGVSLLVFLGVLVWGAVALIGWLWGQTQLWSGTAPDAMRGAARGLLDQVEAIVPGAREKLGEYVPAIKPPAAPQRDVSGLDLGPVARYPGLTRTQSHRDGGETAVEYEGTANYWTVIDHYAKGFAAHGFGQSVQSATPRAEAQQYTKGIERFVVKVEKLPKDRVRVRIETPLQ